MIGPNYCILELFFPGLSFREGPVFSMATMVNAGSFNGDFFQITFPIFADCLLCRLCLCFIGHEPSLLEFLDCSGSHAYANDGIKVLILQTPYRMAHAMAMMLVAIANNLKGFFV